MVSKIHDLADLIRTTINDAPDLREKKFDCNEVLRLAEQYGEAFRETLELDLQEFIYGWHEFIKGLPPPAGAKKDQDHPAIKCYPLHLILPQREILPTNVLYCLVRHNPAWLVSPIVQVQIRYWQNAVLAFPKGRGEFSKKLRGIGAALAKGKGNPQRFGKEILSLYEGAYQIWHGAIKFIKRDFKSRRDLRNPDIVSTLADSEEYKKELGGLCKTLEERIQLIQGVVNHHPAASREAMAFVKVETGLSKWAIRAIVERERKSCQEKSEAKRGGKAQKTKEAAPSH